MAYNGSNSTNESGSGNVWSSGSRGGSRGGYSRNDDDDSGSRGGGSYRGSFGNNNNNSRRGGGSYGFGRQNDGEVQILQDTIFIQNLPKNVSRDEIFDAFSSVGTIKTDDRSGGPKIWIYKDRDTGEGNGRATVAYEDDDTANRAISEYNDQHIESINSTVRVQLAQRRPRNDNDRGGRGGGGYRGGRSNWDNNNSRQGFGSDGNRWGNPRGGFSDNRSGGGYRGQGGGGDSYRDNDDRSGSFGGSRGGGSYRGASRGANGSSNYSPY